LIAKYILDPSGCGHVGITELISTANIKRDYLIRRAKQTSLFKISNNKLFYKSKNKLIPKKIISQYKRKTRAEKISKNFLKNFTCNKNLTSYITKCYAEHHQHKKKMGRRKYIIQGVVSIKDIANYFKISESTVNTNLKRAKAKGMLNLNEYPYIRFKNKNEFENWRLNHMEQEVDGKRVSDNPWSYYFKRIKKNEYCLTQRLPNFYKFTGANLPTYSKRAL